MVNKKGYIQTLEAVIAILILLSVILFSISLRGGDNPSVPEDISLLQNNILSQVQSNYRDCVFDESLCSNFVNLLNEVPVTVGSNYSIDGALFVKPDVDLYVDSIIIVNETNSVKTFTLYLWRK
jgi:hypothetical protein